MKLILVLFFLISSSKSMAMGRFSFFSKNSIDEISIESQVATQAARVDIVFVKESALKPVKSLSALEWFEQKQMLQASFPEEITISASEIPPFYFIDEVELPKSYSKYPKVLLFIHTVGINQAVDLTKNCEPLIRIMKNKVEIIEQDLRCSN